ncbi:protein VAC14 [Trichuris trichiura]|uniref:Protein VAC14 homolog n=1 Tax=Trichuris trichiura TaxID=36087 RepID=A0A077ZGF3_TRITR|nr:protein VAC14 [Trichuris trichiura]
MGDASYAPLSSSLIRQLTDKIYEKRKGGALELEKIVRDFVNENQQEQVEKVLEVLATLMRSSSPHFRKGGLIGLAAVAIAMGPMSERYASQLLLPVLECLQDPDCHIRYYACEASYNIIKVAHKTAMLHFSALFDSFCQLSADPDKNTRNGAELMERQLKDIVLHSDEFDVSEFVRLLRERIYTKNVFIRRYLISWVHDLQAQFSINLVQYLNQILDGLFQILTEQTPRIRELCEVVMGEFLRSIIENPENADLEHMVNVLIVQAQSQDEFAKHIALTWLLAFLNLDSKKMLCYAPGYLMAILPCLSCEDGQENIREVSQRTNTALMKLVSDEVAESEKVLDLAAIVNVFECSLSQGPVRTKIAALEWIDHLYQAMPVRFFAYMEELFHSLLQLLSDPSDEVVSCDVRVLSHLCSGKNSQCANSPTGISGEVNVILLTKVSPYFINFMKSLLNEFRSASDFLSERGTFIIRQLCVVLDAEDVFQTLAVLLNAEDDMAFATQVVQVLNSILLTAPELFNLRCKLKETFSNQTEATLRLEDNVFFSSYFLSGVDSTVHLFVSLLGLSADCSFGALLNFAKLQPRSSARSVIPLVFSCELEVDCQLLVEVDKLIQLLETPIFSYLRLHLLDPRYQQPLAAVLYGLLMLLPQTEAFHLLRRRLQCLPNPSLAINFRSRSPSVTCEKMNTENYFGELLQHFTGLQEKRKAKRY